MPRIFLLLLLFSATLTAAAQGDTATGSLHATCRDEAAAPLQGVTVELLRAKDSLLLRTAISDAGGSAIFEGLSTGSYLLRATRSGLAPSRSGPYTLTPAELHLRPEALTLRPAPSATLGSVTVSARKPFVQQLTDRIVVNVESSPLSAGATALDVLERSPGITLDMNDVIGLRGKQGVIVMIDGKPSPLSAAELANYLRGLPAGAIERIELITNPSARYDAAGNSGIIDIRMKKDSRFGTNGTLTANYGRGFYSRTGAGTTLNHRNKGVNVFGNYNYNYRELFNQLILDRNFFEDGVFTGADYKDNQSKATVGGHSVRAGADFFPSRKTVVGFVVNSNLSFFNRDNVNESVVLDNSRNPASTFAALATNRDRNSNAVANLNFKHTFDSTGREITADADYGLFDSRSRSDNFTQFYKLDGSSLQPDYRLLGDQTGRLRLRTVKTDYVHPLKGGRLEAGGKWSYVSADNNAEFFNRSNGTPEVDVNKTNRFFYNEYNNALYVNGSREWKKWSLQAGLRGEQTRVNTLQVVGNRDTAFSYLRLFPSTFLRYKLNDNNTFGVSVSRRIDRPGYGQLNPFLFLIDVTTYATGSPSLQPQMTWSYEVSYTRKNASLTLNYSHTEDPMNTVIARFGDVFPGIPSDDNVTIQVPVNLGTSDYAGLSLSVPVKVASWWNMANNANVYYNHFSGVLGGVVLDNGRVASDIRSTHNFTFKGGWSGELNGNWSSGGRYGYIVGRSNWSLGAGAQKTIMKNKGTLRLNVTDFFRTAASGGTILYEGRYLERFTPRRDTRAATLAFTYRFGNSKVQAARRRATASEEEARRAGG